MDERYKFVRGGPFDGLDDYASAPELAMKNKTLVYPIAQRERQLSFAGFFTQRQLNENLGYFFELLSLSAPWFYLDSNLGTKLDLLISVSPKNKGDSIHATSRDAPRSNA